MMHLLKDVLFILSQTCDKEKFFSSKGKINVRPPDFGL